MTKSDLIAAIAADADLTQAQAGRALDAMIEHITGAVGSGEVRIYGLGTFSAKRREASEGRNPRTGERIQIAARTVAKFSPAKQFQDRLNP